MHNLPMTTILASLFAVYLFLQGASAQDCVVSVAQKCAKTFATTIQSAPQDKAKICSAGNTYFDCVNQIPTDCTLQSIDVPSYKKAIADARRVWALYGCVGNGASGSVYSIVTIVVGVCLRRLF